MSKGKSKGKGGGGGGGQGGAQAVCYNCGKPGHRKSQCRAPGKGDGKAQDRKSNVTLWVCKGYGPYGEDCPYKAGKLKG